MSERVVNVRRPTAESGISLICSMGTACEARTECTTIGFDPHQGPDDRVRLHYDDFVAHNRCRVSVGIAGVS